LSDQNIPKLKLVDAESLLVTLLPPIEYIVDSLIAPGLYLLVGDSKIGKSWLTLLLCLKVSLGKPFLGLPTKQGEVLYLCLEDNYNRLQNRLFEITDIAHRNLKLAIKANDLTNGLVYQIQDFMADYPNAKLIVIDTLQKVRGISYDNSGAYAADYRDMGILKELADKYKITLLLIHHTSKRPNEKGDPFKKISGTMALMGASDGCFIMTKEDYMSKRAMLTVTGRDIESRSFSTIQNNNFIWEMERVIGAAEIWKLTEPPVIGAVEQFMKDRADWTGTASELAASLEMYLKESMAPHSMMAAINRFHMNLADNGILYETKRTSQQRIVTLMKPLPVMDSDEADNALDSR